MFLNDLSATDSTHFICNNSVTKYNAVYTEELYLDYRSVRNDADVLVPTFTGYQLACFKTKMNMELQSENRYCVFVNKSTDNGSAEFLEIYDRNGFVPLSLKDIELYQPIVDKHMYYRNDHMAIFNARQNLTYQKTSIPSLWMSTMIPHLLLPNQLYNKESCEIEYDNGIIYARFNDNIDYYQSARYLELYIRESLTKLYNTGCIILDSIIDSDLISRWNLINYIDMDPQHRDQQLISRQLLSDNSHIYTTQWCNTLIAPQPTQFLLTLQEESNYITFNGELHQCNNINDLEDIIIQMLGY